MSCVYADHSSQKVVNTQSFWGGKSVALGALEDFGFYCIDNLPRVS